MLLAGAAAAGQSASPERELAKRVASYMETRKQACSDIPKLKDKAEPDEIASHKRAMAVAIQGARANARQGDILTPPVQAYLKQIIRSEMAGKQGKPAKESAKQGNPEVEGAVPVAVKVNAAYPDGAPLSTVPPTLLQRLPKLPDGLDFRFVGRDLILRDANAGIIVDFVSNAMP